MESRKISAIKMRSAMAYVVLTKERPPAASLNVSFHHSVSFVPYDWVLPVASQPVREQQHQPRTSTDEKSVYSEQSGFLRPKGIIHPSAIGVGNIGDRDRGSRRGNRRDRQQDCQDADLLLLNRPF